MESAKEVGGDFYDFFMIDDAHVAIVIADVSGKGVGSALFMVTAKTLIKDHKVDSGRRKLGAIIGDSVKTGINSSFSPGVKIGSNATIGSGVLLYEDVPSDTRVLVKQNHIIQKKKDD